MPTAPMKLPAPEVARGRKSSVDDAMHEVRAITSRRGSALAEAAHRWTTFLFHLRQL